MTDQEARQIASVIYLQRENLNSIEETWAILDLLSLELNLHRSEVITLLHKLKNQGGNDAISKVENVFDGLINMSWLSFVQNRLPLVQNSQKIYWKFCTKGKLTTPKRGRSGK